MAIVTKQSLIELLKDEGKQQHVIGRALMALVQYQTQAERTAACTFLHNNVGFTSADAYVGTLTANFYHKHHYLMPWMVRKWMKPMSNGTPRVAKYWKQLNSIAEQRKSVHV
jgi:hypothetical protein